MALSNSKQLLADAIHTAGGIWPDEALFAWYGNLTGMGYFASKAPAYNPEERGMDIDTFALKGTFPSGKVPHWHRTVLTKSEYLTVYPLVLPKLDTIEELAAEYRKKVAALNVIKEAALAAEHEVEKAHKAVSALCAQNGISVITLQSTIGNVFDIEDLLPGDIIKAVPYGDERDVDTRFKGGWGTRNLHKEFAVLRIEDGEIYIDSFNPLNPQNCTDSGEAFEFIRRP